MVQPLWRPVWSFLKKVKTELPYDPAIPLLGIYLEKYLIGKGACTPVFTAAPFTTAKTRKQPKHPTAEEWIKKVWSVSQSRPTLCNPVNRSMSGCPVHHQLPEFTQTHIHQVCDAISHLILCRPLLLLPPIPSSIGVLSSESTISMRWPKYWSFISS